MSRNVLAHGHEWPVCLAESKPESDMTRESCMLSEFRVGPGAKLARDAVRGREVPSRQANAPDAPDASSRAENSDCCRLKRKALLPDCSGGDWAGCRERPPLSLAAATTGQKPSSKKMLVQSLPSGWFWRTKTVQNMILGAFEIEGWSFQRSRLAPSSYGGKERSTGKRGNRGCARGMANYQGGQTRRQSAASQNCRYRGQSHAVADAMIMRRHRSRKHGRSMAHQTGPRQ
mmetsp:Transcript_17118/g.48946  ORF Transcript_17118/g.48946 Transcript_17118/m.48946 type:complete len:231 (-) Transcript_17118:834-1526(-)